MANAKDIHIAFEKNLELQTFVSLIFLRGAQTLTFGYKISTLQPPPHINREASRTLIVLFLPIFTYVASTFCLKISKSATKLHINLSFPLVLPRDALDLHNSNGATIECVMFVKYKGDQFKNI